MTTFISPHLITIIDKNQITFSLYGWGSPLKLSIKYSNINHRIKILAAFEEFWCRT